jgi:hypothetical protein
MRICKAEGRPWFRETLAVVGRRGSKGYLGGTAGATVLWRYLNRANPQQHYGVDPDKRLTALVFGGKKEQAKANQWRDFVNVILGAPCYSPYISTSLGESLTIYSRGDRRRLQRLIARGIYTGMDIASFEILPKESTSMAGRGPAACIAMFDEMAHTTNIGANREATEVWDATTPALDQFGVGVHLRAVVTVAEARPVLRQLRSVADPRTRRARPT